MDDERASVKANSKRGTMKKRWKKTIEKDMLARGLKRSDGQDHTMWRLDCKTCPPELAEKQAGFQNNEVYF